MGRFYLSYVEQENLLHRSFPPEIPNKISCYLLIRFHKKTIPLSVHNYRAFTLISVRGLPSYVPRSKDRPPLKELSIYSLSWSGPADSHFVHSFFHKCIVFIYQPGQPGFNGGACVLRVGCQGKVVPFMTYKNQVENWIIEKW